MKEDIKVTIHINSHNMDESFVFVNGNAIHGINRLELRASCDHTKRTELILHLHPDVIDVRGDAEVIALLDLKADRFSNLDTEDE